MFSITLDKENDKFQWIIYKLNNWNLKNQGLNQEINLEIVLEKKEMMMVIIPMFLKKLEKKNIKIT